MDIDDLITALCKEIDSAAILTGEDATFHQDSWSLGMSKAPLVLRPASTAEVAAIMRCCHSRAQTVVTQGGKTGLVQGCFAGENDVVISMERMTHIEEIDEINRTMTVQAGVILQQVQEAAQEHDLMYPQDFGARGSATIGGNIATNAGGNRVIRFGMTREMTLGLEAVLADGTVISSMNHMLKNNAGYDLKQLFIGSEGTLGIVTRAVLRLRPALCSQNTALLAVNEFDCLPKLLTLAEARLGGALCAFEVMWDGYYSYASQGEHIRHAMDAGYPYYVLIESLGPNQELDAQLFEELLEHALTHELIIDAVIASSQAERDNLWAIRDNVESMVALWPFYIFDISLNLSFMHEYLKEVEQRLAAAWGDAAKCAVFGHLGDGNLHLIISVGGEDTADRAAVEDIVYSALGTRGGSVSAEHGIGTEKKPYLHYSRHPEEIALMRALKQALDPQGLLNAGLVFDT